MASWLKMDISSSAYRSLAPYAWTVSSQVWEGDVVSKDSRPRIPNKKNRMAQSTALWIEG